MVLGFRSRVKGLGFSLGMSLGFRLWPGALCHTSVPPPACVRFRHSVLGIRSGIRI